MQQPIEASATRLCNCRNPSLCPLNGKCLTNNIVYQATVKSRNSTETYIGLTENTFKNRYNNHTASFRHNKLKNSTELSKHIWQLKDQNIDHHIEWRIVKRARAFNNKSKRCNLCLTEKLYIIYHTEKASLNKRSELMSTCRHQAKYLLHNSSTNT
jgi:hypothetical protein